LTFAFNPPQVSLEFLTVKWSRGLDALFPRLEAPAAEAPSFGHFALRESEDFAGGLDSDTIAEDTDLTLSLHRMGWRVNYVPEAIAWTEAPDTIRGLAKQRFRWAFGTMQCLWKHRNLILPTLALSVASAYRALPSSKSCSSPQFPLLT
jgi:cellulose synthase/poly-beta-1,6-N-acetylglucosamine synthase-like glycosyltransferase